MVRVADFMIPRSQVATCEPTDSIQHALDIMIKKDVGCVLVLVHGTCRAPIGIVTKTDLVAAYNHGVHLDHSVREIMSKDLHFCQMTDSRDQAAATLEKFKNHHILVIDQEQHFQGLISSFDIIAECAKDDKAWPWNRSPADGRYYMINSH